MRAAALAAAVIAGFLGVMYLRFSGDTVPAPEATSTPVPAQVSLRERCERYGRYPKPPQCGASIGWSGQTLLAPVVTPAPAPPPPSILDGVDVIPLKMGPDIELPQDVALIIETGCWQCEGPTTGFVRVYRDAVGAVRTDRLLDPSALGFAPRMVSTLSGITPQEPYVTGFAVALDASDMVVSMCIKETCGGGGLDSWSAGSETVVLRSPDGGVTWSEFGRIDSGGFVVALVDNGRAIIGKWDAENRPPTFAYFPSLEPVQTLLEGSWPVSFLDGQVLWRTPSGGGLMLGDHHLVDFGGNAGVASVAVAPPDSEPRLAVSWNLPRTTAEQAYFLTLIDSRGRSFETYEFGTFAMAEVNLIAELFGNVDGPRAPSPGGYLPAVIDMSARLMRPITHPFLEPMFLGGRNHIVAIQRGPFARVVNTEGTCLYIRETPDTNAPALDCAAEGVLLRLLADVQGPADASWVRVATPSGVEGWASGQYLER